MDSARHSRNRSIQISQVKLSHHTKSISREVPRRWVSFLYSTVCMWLFVIVHLVLFQVYVLHVNGFGVVIILCSPWYPFVVLYGRSFVVVGNFVSCTFLNWVYHKKTLRTTRITWKRAPSWLKPLGLKHWFLFRYWGKQEGRLGQMTHQAVCWKILCPR